MSVIVVIIIIVIIIITIIINNKMNNSYGFFDKVAIIPFITVFTTFIFFLLRMSRWPLQCWIDNTNTLGAKAQYIIILISRGKRNKIYFDPFMINKYIIIHLNMNILTE